MAVYEASVLASRTPLKKLIKAAITGTLEDTLVFSQAMTRFVAYNTGTEALTFIIDGNPDLTDTLEAGEAIDDEFPEFDHVILSGTVGSGYKVRVG
ncbi:hypothetical protein [Sporomusa termitida]|uniref:Uncharacterized protein n=1 Tax=Sporomusa termitida TaxID=2377 RepID=A0A517DVJ6_9FIRM|nr:hypothetical protein [Sporomusa termitida]QDR81347.1 hypothetical protein SPTER_27260 [Sporomusa termitida]